MASLPHSRPMVAPSTVDDLAGLPDDGNRYELIGGEILVSPAPSIRHQRLVARLFALLWNHLAETGAGEVFGAPTDVRLSPQHDQVQPDLLVVTTQRSGIIGHARIEGSPDLIVEVLSPATRRTDLVTKAALYSQAGVPEYWTVDPEAGTTMMRRLQDGTYVPASQDEGGRLRSEVLPGFSLDPAAFFSGLPVIGGEEGA